MPESLNVYALVASLLLPLVGGTWIFLRTGYSAASAVSRGMWMTFYSVVPVTLFWLIAAELADLAGLNVFPLAPVVVLAFLAWMSTLRHTRTQDASAKTSLWGHWAVRFPLTFAGVGALLYWLIAPSYDEYQMMSGHWEKVFQAGSGRQPKDTDFTVRGCKNVTGRPRPDGLKAIEWQTDGTAVVKYVVSDYCTAPFNYGGYSVADNILTLDYRIKWRSPMRAACTCAYELEYRIKNLTRKDYSVQVRDVTSN